MSLHGELLRQARHLAVKESKKPRQADVFLASLLISNDPRGH